MPRTVGVTPTSYPVAVTITGGTAARACTVKIMCRRTDESASEVSESNTATLDLANLSKNGVFSGFQNGDVLDIQVTGGSFGSATITIDRSANPGGHSVSIATTDTTSTNTPGATV